MSLLNLLKNERLKQYKKLSTWILIGVILLFMILSVCLTKYMYSQNYYSWGRTWQEDYASNIQMYQQDEHGKYLAQAYTYLLENNIPPSDWRSDPYKDYYSRQQQLQELEASLEGLDEASAASIRQQITELKKQADTLKELADKNDWRAYIQYQIDEKQAAMDKDSFLTNEETQIEIDILRLYLDYDIRPVSEETINNLQYSMYSNDSVEDKWKYQQLSDIKAKRFNLLRGEDDTGLLNANRKKELELEVRIAEERLKTNAQPVESNSFLGLFDSTVSTMSLISLILMVLAGGMIATEFSTGTVKLLLITPHKRREIFWAKALVLLEITLISAGALFIVGFLLCGILSGFSGIGEMQVLSLFGQVVRLPYLLFILFKYLLNLLPVLVYGALALMLSAVTRKGAVAIAVSIILYVGGSMVTTILNALSYAGIIIPGMKFLFFCNTNLTGYLPGMDSMMNMGMPAGLKIDPTMTLSFSVVVLLIYLVCFLWTARDSFCRRDIK